MITVKTAVRRRWNPPDFLNPEKLSAKQRIGFLIVLIGNLRWGIATDTCITVRMLALLGNTEPNRRTSTRRTAKVKTPMNATFKLGRAGAAGLAVAIAMTQRKKAARRLIDRYRLTGATGEATAPC